MIKTSTLKELSEFSQNEADIRSQVFPKADDKSPKASVVQNILNYSKSLSVRETKTIGKQLMTLN